MKEEVLRKIKALTNSPYAAESSTAKDMLEKLMLKYGVTETDLDIQEEHKYEFKTDKNFKWQGTLMMQIIYAVTASKDIFYYKKHPEIKIAKTTPEKAFEIRYMFDFYKKVFNEDIQTLLSAFIQKHRIFPPTTEESELPEPYFLSEEDKKMFAMMDGLSNKQCEIHKAIPSKV